MLETENDVLSIVFNPDDIAEAFAHIEEQWPLLTKDQPIDDGTLIGLPNGYVVPSVETEGGFVFNEMYYWDNYFVLQGLKKSGRQELAEGMLENMIYLAKRFHIIPNASRYYHTSRSQPPFLTSYIFEIYDTYEKSDTWLKERIAVAEKEYNTVWMGTTQPNIRNVHKGLSRNYDINVTDDLAECESGWDMTTRFSGQALSHLPVDLNSLLYKYEKDFARAYKVFGDHESSVIWNQKAALRAETMSEILWDEERGFFFDYNFKIGKLSDIWSLAGFYPLWAGLASQSQAERMLDNITRFLYKGGLATTDSPEHTDPREFPKQWAYPNGWAPLNWLTVKGLMRYGYRKEADEIARRWIKTNLDYYLNFGVFREAYNVVSPLDKPLEGLYPSQTGFGWTNAVFIDLCKQFLSEDELQKVY